VSNQPGMITAKDLMSSPVVTIHASATVADAARLMIDNDISCLPVTADREKLVGILTHTDFTPKYKFLAMAGDLYTLMGEYVTPETMQNVAKEVRNRTVDELMKTPVVTVKEDAPISEITELMLERRLNRLPITRDKKIVGIFTRHDLLKLMLEQIAG
jgi:CBS domain-containing protein